MGIFTLLDFAKEISKVIAAIRAPKKVLVTPTLANF